MNAAEAGQLLAFAALYDNRKVSDPDVMAWMRALGDLPYPDCETAVAGHYGEATERIMPGHIRQRVKRIREDRLARTPLPAPPREAADEPGRYQRIIAANIARIADGLDVRQALPAGPLPGEPPAEWQKAKEAITPPELVKRDPREVALEQLAEARAKRESAPADGAA